MISTYVIPAIVGWKWLVVVPKEVAGRDDVVQGWMPTKCRASEKAETIAAHMRDRYGLGQRAKQ
jgi:hypothetical protein